MSQPQVPLRTSQPRGYERTLILDAARFPAQQELGQPVELDVRSLRVSDGWAFVYAKMLSPGGRNISYAGTRYQAAFERGHKSDSLVSLLKRHDHQGWAIVASAIGPTDAVWQGWTGEYDAPAGLIAVEGR